MRTNIKFRGKRKDNNEWIYGSLIINSHMGRTDYYITDNGMGQIYVNSKKVILETIGQHIFLQDKNGKDAYVGDIFVDEHGVYRTIMQVPGGFACESNPVSFGYGFQCNFNPLESLSDQQTASWFESNCEIVGNIFDNSDLLK